MNFTHISQNVLIEINTSIILLTDPIEYFNAMKTDNQTLYHCLDKSHLYIKNNDHSVKQSEDEKNRYYELYLARLFTYYELTKIRTTENKSFSANNYKEKKATNVVKNANNFSETVSTIISQPQTLSEDTFNYEQFKQLKVYYNSKTNISGIVVNQESNTIDIVRVSKDLINIYVDRISINSTQNIKENIKTVPIVSYQSIFENLFQFAKNKANLENTKIQPIGEAKARYLHIILTKTSAKNYFICIQLPLNYKLRCWLLIKAVVLDSIAAIKYNSSSTTMTSNFNRNPTLSLAVATLELINRKSTSYHSYYGYTKRAENFKIKSNFSVIMETQRLMRYTNIELIHHCLEMFNKLQQNKITDTWNLISDLFFIERLVDSCNISCHDTKAPTSPQRQSKHISSSFSQSTTFSSLYYRVNKKIYNNENAINDAKRNEQFSKLDLFL